VQTVQAGIADHATCVCTALQQLQCQRWLCVQWQSCFHESFHPHLCSEMVRDEHQQTSAVLLLLLLLPHLGVAFSSFLT
jgi:hypothetical protein